MALLATLTDNFTTVTGNWGGDLTIASGVASIVADANYHSAYSTVRYDATGSYLACQVTPPATGNTFDVSIRVVQDSNNYASALIVGSVLSLRVRNAGVNTDTTVGAWNATTHKYLRLRENGGAFTLDTSNDGTTWTARATSPHTFPVTSVGASLNAGSWDAAVTGAATFDNINQAGSGNTAANTPPTIVPSASGAEYWPGDTATVSCYAVDPESVPTVTWTQTVGPAVTITPSGQTATFTVPAVATETNMTFRASATDGTYTTTGDVTITALPSSILLRATGGMWTTIP